MLKKILFLNKVILITIFIVFVILVIISSVISWKRERNKAELYINSDFHDTIEEVSKDHPSFRKALAL